MVGESKMKRIDLASAAALAASLAMAAPATAADDPNAAVKAEADRARALTDRFNAEKALFDAKWGALNLPTAEGKVTVADTAGKMEATILSATAMQAAAKAIATANPKRTKIIVLSDAETADFSLPETLGLEMDTLTDAAVGYVCPGQPRAATMMAVPPLAVAGALIDVLKVDTEVRGLTLETDSGALAHAVAGELKSAAYIPSESTLPAGFAASPIVAKWKLLSGERARLAKCRSDLLAADNKPEVATVDAILARIDAFAARATASTNGASPLVRAAALQALAADKPVVLRVTGGTMIRRTSLWTAFGALGVRVTGGLLASYRYVDPANGQVLADGLLICRTELARLSVVQRGQFAATCAPALKR
jgi:hypothetical protein